MEDPNKYKEAQPLYRRVSNLSFEMNEKND